jgi:methylmalonyl-CoA mutase C-terminal domain/subunit
VERVLLAKLGLDGHDRGLRVLARELTTRGVEVILLGLGTDAEVVVRSAVAEDVDVIAVSLLSGSHMTLVPDVLRIVADEGADIPVVCGGLIPRADAEALRVAGAAGVAAVGTSLEQAARLIIDVAEASHRRRSGAGATKP